MEESMPYSDNQWSSKHHKTSNEPQYSFDCTRSFFTERYIAKSAFILELILP